MDEKFELTLNTATYVVFGVGAVVGLVLGIFLF